MTRNVAVIGHGRMGMIHARNVMNNPRLSLKYIVGRDDSKISQFTSSMNGVTGTTDLNVVLNDPAIDGIIICSPTDSHASQIKMCIDAGKPVFCEKPVALTTEEIKECFDLSRSKNVPLFCGYQRRFDPDIKHTKKIAEDYLGGIQLLRITSRDHPAPPTEYLTADSTGSFFDDFSTHDVDYARWIVGEEPEKIYATASSFTGVDDTAVIVMKFPCGALCVIDNSRQTTYGYDIRAEVLGENGMATLKNPHVNMVVVSTQDGHGSSHCNYSFPQRFDDAYKNELEHFIDILDGKESLITAKDCIQASQITGSAQACRLLQAKSDSASVPGEFDKDPYPTVDANEFGVIVFGTGRMGRVRATSIQTEEGVNVLYGFDVIEDSVKSFAKDFNCTGFVLNDENLQKALSDPKVGAVFVSTTSSSHCTLILASLNAGKHVFCEKPLALTAADTEKCVRLALEKGLALYCGFHRRSDIHFMKLKESIQGTKQLIRVTSREPASNSGIAYLLASGGFLFDSVIHDIDMAIYLANEYPFEVYCQANAFNPTLKEAGDVDAIVVILRFPSGCIVSIDNHRNAVYGYDQRAEVHTDVGMYSVENLGFTATQIANSKGFTTDNPPDFLARYKDAYIDETKHFISLLKGKTKTPRSPIRDYVVTAKIAETARESLAKGMAIPFSP